MSAYVFKFVRKCQIDGRRMDPQSERTGQAPLSAAQVKAEIAKGKHKTTKQWLSPYLRHAECISGDMSIFDDDMPSEKAEEEKGQSIEEVSGDIDRNVLKSKLDTLGIGYAKNTPTAKLQELLANAEAE